MLGRGRAKPSAAPRRARRQVLGSCGAAQGDAGASLGTAAEWIFLR